MIHRLTQLYESIGTRDVVQIAILAVVIYGVLHFVGRTCGAGSPISRGLGLVVVGLFLLAQVVVAALDLTELSTVFDYLLLTALTGLIIIFQPELRRGLMMLGRSSVWRYFAPQGEPLADRLADAAIALSRDCVGALIAIQREVGLAPWVETGERLDAEISAPLIRTIFSPRSPLHDGAIILSSGRIAAAGCQLPLVVRDGRQPGSGMHMGMRHRAALCLSEETDALLLVVSEETGRIALAFGGRLEPVPRENLSRRLAALLAAPGGYPVRKLA
ncbi:MAG: diadenylate cyclase [Gemmataceae bacterium]|nr:diadenylate cyclase [Gemmataceae bacterium]